jgi:choline dehydrogenase-like flavoprotein
MTADFVVVGSGCSGAMAAQTLVEGGARVTMLDVGFDAPELRASVPARDFLDLRRTDEGQHRYFIGDAAEGVAWGKVARGEHITPPRRHILRDVDRLLPVEPGAFLPFESLGYGGLGIGWGLGCWEYSPAELEAAGLPVERMRAAYREISARIGVSGEADDATEYTLGDLDNYQPAARMDRNHELVARRYAARRARLRADGFVLGRAPLALLTRDLGERRRYAYRDMDFYADLDHSAWRPWMTVDALRRRGLEYLGGRLLLRFRENADDIELECLVVASGERETLRCRRLVLAASALGSARVVLRSGAVGQAPLLSNAYAYIPCVQPALVGRGAEPRKLGFSQLSLFLDEAGDHREVAMASLYSYQSLMLFRIIKQAPLNFVDAAVIMRYLSSGFLIAGLHQPDGDADAKRLALVRDAASPTGDRLRVDYEVPAAAAAVERRRVRKYVRALRRLGAYALRVIDPGAGASIHYAGTLPFSARSEPGRLSPDGRLHGTRGVYVADSSGFTYLPAKGLTFSLMANAHLTAQRALRDE